MLGNDYSQLISVAKCGRLSRLSIVMRESKYLSTGIEDLFSLTFSVMLVYSMSKLY